ncbi:MAG: penicillin-binding protein 2 [Gammaproteobacteria bacterium]|nr:MAG: penicillin-binding protein 2 [Gammaproteobacteria bacterium]
MSPQPLKDAFQESSLIRSRLAFIVALCILCFAALLARLFFLQVVHYQHFATLSKDNRIKVLPIPPTRGLIFDRHGVLLAENVPTFQLEIVPEDAGDVADTLSRLKAVIPFTEEDEKRFYRLKGQRPRFMGIPLRDDLTEEEVAKFAVHRHQFPGVDVVARLRRHYPLGALGVHVLGYVGQIDIDELRQLDASNYSGTSHIGKVGVERFYEARLHGKVGIQQAEVNAQGRILRILHRTPSVPGQNLFLTLDARLQGIAEEALKGHTGAIVAIQPKTGEVLALASMPTYDPNAFAQGIDAKTYHALQHSPKRPLFNRALRGQYPPGSTIKPLVALAGLEYGLVTPSHTTFCPGWFTLTSQGHRFRCWRRYGHGKVDLKKAIVESCDVYFYDLASTLGIDRLHAFLSQFGLGRKTRIDLTGERSGLLPSRAWKRAYRHQPWFPGETVIAGIGQGFMLATPLQLAVATATLANHGLYLRPHLLYAYQEGDRFALSSPPIPQAIPMAAAAHWETVIDAMVGVVHGKHGTARKIGLDAPYLIAGKTGTAQVFGLKQDERYNKDKIAKKLQDHALFIAFAPAEDPQIAVAVVVENGGSGSSAAAPLARQVMDAYLLGHDI